MSAAVAQLIARCRAAGLSLTVEGEALHVDFECPPAAELVEELRRNKSALLATLGTGRPGSPATVIAPARWFEDPAAAPRYREPCAARRGLIRDREGHRERFCSVCGAWGAFGYDA